MLSSSTGVKQIVRRTGAGLTLGLAAAMSLFAQDLKEFEKRVTEFTLPNGLHFVIATRREAPVVSFHTYVRTGSVEDPAGQTGLAHMLEHMAFKGTETIGTKDWAAEKKALDAVEEAYDRFEAELNKPKPDVGKTGAAQIALNRAIAAANALVKPGEYRRILEENGAVGVNATAGADATEFTCSLPSNRIELWFLMESQRLLRPVFREFYSEREIVLDEVKERVDAAPQGKLSHALRATALLAHPYRNPPLGWPSEIVNLRMRNAREFFDRYYVPGNIRIAIAGDVDPAEARKLAERYFGAMPSRSMPPLVRTIEPAQSGPRSIAVEAPGQPTLLVAFHRPEQTEADDPVLDIIQLILGGGRTAWLYKTLVDEKRTSQGIQCIANFPGGKYASLFTVQSVTAPGRSVDENQMALDEVIGRLIHPGVDKEALDRAKMQVRAALLNRLASNAGVAYFLAVFQGEFQDWRRMFQNLEDLSRVTATDVQRVAGRYFSPANRTVAYTVPPPKPAVAAPAKPGARR
jgi:predicted Zn-dependent peptidase